MLTHSQPTSRVSHTLKHRRISFEALGLTTSGTLVHCTACLAECVAPGLTRMRTLEDAAKTLGWGICLSASLHWHGGAFITLESVEA